jgi:hypothetical protein
MRREGNINMFCIFRFGFFPPYFGRFLIFRKKNWRTIWEAFVRLLNTYGQSWWTKARVHQPSGFAVCFSSDFGSKNSREAVNIRHVQESLERHLTIPKNHSILGVCSGFRAIPCLCPVFQKQALFAKKMYAVVRQIQTCANQTQLKIS